ncbi:hypothetical protein [Psychroserpens ponticola]|uniref:Lipocalin-like domain-containing protein n=1 Tax=Psychroserpens ponticola TaxID=2932268 RepID=A0ABY7RTS9_9FLAO|nr:hypothetical protein [Psychroserpens ponticola]WCO00319.1 hypothetical protein MUN68_009570 [Psychroserpens ponticola]
MKTKLIISALSISLFICTSCNEKKHLIVGKNGKTIDTRLVGLWKGSESGKIFPGMSSEWKMIRNLDGTFSLEVKANLNGEFIEETEIGTWWIENGCFHEYHDVSGKVDIYKYEVLNKDQIKFITKKMSFDIVNENYEFIDTKISN